MWFTFISVGGVATLIIIVSLWEKFQIHPTITGLDTDYHNWDVPFPTVSLCPTDPVNNTAVREYVEQ
jgi:Amiloride-sensitive sodium channel.